MGRPSEIGLGHVHDWSNKHVVDRCHYVEVEKTCKTCGALHQEREPRDFDLDPLEVAFAREGCERCRQMLKGSEPTGWETSDGVR